MKDRPVILQQPETDQKKKMASFSCEKDDIPAGVELDQNSYARDKLLWVQLTRENILNYDFMEGTRETLQRILHLTDLVRILMRQHMQGGQVPGSLSQNESPISIVEDVWLPEDVTGGTNDM